MNFKGLVRFKFFLLQQIICFLIADFVIKKFVVVGIQTPELIFSTPFGIDFYIEYITNRGAAWGLFSSMHIPLLVFRIFIVIGLFFYTFGYCKSKMVMIALCAIIEGALSNIWDCFYFGHVVDMFHFVFWGHSYGIFNLADTSIFFGTVFLMIQLSKKQKKRVEDGSS